MCSDQMTRSVVERIVQIEPSRWEPVFGDDGHFKKVFVTTNEKETGIRVWQESRPLYATGEGEIGRTDEYIVKVFPLGKPSEQFSFTRGHAGCPSSTGYDDLVHLWDRLYTHHRIKEHENQIEAEIEAQRVAKMHRWRQELMDSL